MTGIAEIYRRSLDHPEEFWAEAVFAAIPAVISAAMRMTLFM